MKKKLSLLLLLMIAILTIGCGSTKKPETAVNDTVNGFFKAMKEFDVDKMSKYTGEDIGADIDIDSTEEVDVFMIDFIKQLNAKMSYKISSTTVNDDTATVVVACTYFDAATLLTELFSNVTTDDFSELTATATEMIESGDYDQFVDEDITVTLNKTDGEWIIEFDNTLQNIFVANIYATE